MIIHVPLLLNFAGAYRGSLQVPDSLSRTWYLTQLNYGGIDLLVCRPGHQLSLICLLRCASSSDMDALMRSLCGRTMPYGAIGNLLAVTMVVFARMPFMWTSVVVCWTLHNSPLITRPPSLSGSND